MLRLIFINLNGKRMKNNKWLTKLTKTTVISEALPGFKGIPNDCVLPTRYAE